MTICRRLAFIFFCLVTLSCQKKPGASGGDHLSGNYIQVLEQIELAGNRYRAAMDLTKYGATALERSLAESHLQLTRELLESEFQLAEVESKLLPLRDSKSVKKTSTAQNSAEQGQYEKAAAEVWKIYSELENAKQRLTEARQKLKRATTAEAFRHAQQAVDQAQKEVMIADRKLDLAGSNLDIEDYRRRKGPAIPEQFHSPAERLNAMREELFPTAGKQAPSGAVNVKSSEEQRAPLVTEPVEGGIIASLRDYFQRREKFQTLRRIQREAIDLESRIRERLEERLGELEKLQIEHMELNRRADAAYSRAYKLLENLDKTTASGFLEEADRLMSTSAGFEEQKELANRGIAIVRKQGVLAGDDHDKLTSWVAVATDESHRSLLLAASRISLVMALIFLILLISYYLKKLPYRFTRDGKNLYYFRKLISFSAGLMIAAIILLNFIGDFGSVTAVVGLAGAGLAIALQDPIVSMVGWFLIVGKFGISVGDRVEINHVKGDVIDIGLLRIAVLEVGNWISAEQSTGRVVFFPNNFIFKNHFFNYSTGSPFIWDEIKITVTYESDWKKARQIIEGVALKVSQEFIEQAKMSQDQVSRRFHINLGTLTPYVYVSIAESGVDLLLRYLTEIRRRRLTHDQIVREILEAFEQGSDLNLAYPTRRNLTESRSMPDNAETKSALDKDSS